MVDAARKIGFQIGILSALLWWAPPAFSSEETTKEIPLDTLALRAPPLILRSGDGATKSLADFHGKPLLLHFWASWCAPCQKELPVLADLVKVKGGGEIQFLPVSIDALETQPKARALLASLAPRLPFWSVGDAPDKSEGKSLWAWGLPLTYFVSPDGILVARAMGPRDWAAMSADSFRSRFNKGK